MSMNTHEFYDCVSELIENNEIDIKYIDDAVRRILRAKFRIGLFDGKKTVDRSVINCNEHKKLNHKLAQESAVLLKNDGTLPLKGNKTIAVIGPNADDIRAIYGDWTYFSHPFRKKTLHLWATITRYVAVWRKYSEKRIFYTAKAVTF